MSAGPHLCLKCGSDLVQDDPMLPSGAHVCDPQDAKDFAAGEAWAAECLSDTAAIRFGRIFHAFLFDRSEP